MDCYTAWQSADHCIVICNNPDSVWQNVQNLYVYGNLAPEPEPPFCGRTHAVHWKELYRSITEGVCLEEGNYCALACIIFLLMQQALQLSEIRS